MISMQYDQFSSLMVQYENKEISSRELAQRLPAAICATWDLYGEVDEVDLDGLLGNRIGQESRTRIGLALIRGFIVTRAEDELAPSQRGRMFGFLDQTFSGPVYSAASIDVRDQNFEKSRKLTGLYQAIASEMNETASSIVNLPVSEEEFSRMRGRILSTFNHNTTRMLMAPFWRGVRGFEDVLGLVGGYITTREVLSYDSYVPATQGCENYLQQIAEIGSIDSAKHQGGVISKLLKLIEEDMEKPPYGSSSRYNDI